MLWNDIATLIAYTETTDEYGDAVQTESKRQVFVNKKSVRQSEYYQALSVGLKPEIMLEVKSIDYDNEKNITYDSKSYNIIRVYPKKGEVSELICRAVI